MNVLRLLAAGVAIVLFSGLWVEAKEEKKDTAKLLIGTWEVAKSFEKGPPVGALMEFTKDGKAKGTAKVEGKDIIHEGTYKVEGNKVTILMKEGEKEHKTVITIKTITDSDMVVENDAGKPAELKRKKP